MTFTPRKLFYSPRSFTCNFSKRVCLTTGNLLLFHLTKRYLHMQQLTSLLLKLCIDRGLQQLVPVPFSLGDYPKLNSSISTLLSHKFSSPTSDLISLAFYCVSLRLFLLYSLFELSIQKCSYLIHLMQFEMFFFLFFLISSAIRRSLAQTDVCICYSDSIVQVFLMNITKL